eukprot:3688139-Rhodomonas_salina.1
MRQLHLIRLDQWTFDVHRGSHGHEHVAHSSAFALLTVGDIHSQEFESFLGRVDLLLKKSEDEAKKNKSTRNAAHNQRSHQWTPSFLHAVMTRVRTLSVDSTTTLVTSRDRT